MKAIRIAGHCAGGPVRRQTRASGGKGGALARGKFDLVDGARATIEFFGRSWVLASGTQGACLAGKGTIMPHRTLRTVAFGLVASAFSASAALAGLVGPTAYTSFVDSPFNGVDFSAGYFHLENFEDLALNVPGVGQIGGSAIGPGGLTDSVDEDDGAIDGSGTNGHSFFGSGPAGITFQFDDSTLGSLPTHAGIVWTDGEGTISFEAFDQNGASLGTIGPFSDPGVVPDASFSGGTAEDRFFGATNDSGISKIFISNTSGGIEVDHLQFGNGVGGPPPPPPPNGIPLPAGVWGGLVTLAAAAATGAYQRVRRGALV
jgi:hypothetical protein